MADDALAAAEKEAARLEQERDNLALEVERLTWRNEKLRSTIHALPDAMHANAAANLAHARHERDLLRAAIGRVRELHAGRAHPARFGAVCAQCGVVCPCPTAKALWSDEAREAS